jgi:hypothetical protein
MGLKGQESEGGSFSFVRRCSHSRLLAARRQSTTRPLMSHCQPLVVTLSISAAGFPPAEKIFLSAWRFREAACARLPSPTVYFLNSTVLRSDRRKRLVRCLIGSISFRAYPGAPSRPPISDSRDGLRCPILESAFYCEMQKNPSRRGSHQQTSSAPTRVVSMTRNSFPAGSTTTCSRGHFP